jgi:uncharacterized protein
MVIADNTGEAGQPPCTRLTEVGSRTTAAGEGEDMQFMLLGYDGKDDDALGRRLAARDQHLALGDQLVAEGKLLFATAILDADEKMIGSMLVLEFPSPAELDAWLATEPYVTGDVWRTIEILPAKVSPSFTRSSQR